MRADAGKVMDRKFRESIVDERRNAADAVFERYEFGAGVNVEGFNGWDDTDTNDWIRVVYVHFDDDGPNEPTHKVSFHVKFANDVDPIVEEAYGLIVKTGNEIGRFTR